MIRTATAAFLAVLLAGPAVTLAQAPAQAPAQTPSGTPPTSGRLVPPLTSRPTTPPSTLATNQFSAEAAAKAHCPGDTVVWANTGGSKAYHLPGTKYYGKTKHGAYMCQKEADQGGFHVGGRHSAKKQQAPKPS